MSANYGFRWRWHYHYGEEGNDILYGGEGGDFLYGGNGDDILYGGEGGDFLYGGNGDDKLYGDQGNDVFVGGKGNDYLEGSKSTNYKEYYNNTYLFSRGDGNDIINNYDRYNYQKDDVDIIKFTDVNSDEITFRGENYDLIIEYGGGDSIRIQNFFSGDYYWINEIHFADGVVFTHAELEKIHINISVTADYVDFISWKGKVTLITHTDKNTTLNGSRSDDVLLGGVENDKLMGIEGNDIFIGGKGDDYLIGGEGAGPNPLYSNGNKIYQFSKGDGNDTINNYEYNNEYVHDVDIIKFTDVKSNEVKYRNDENNKYDLIIEYGLGDSIRVENFFIALIIKSMKFILQTV